MNVISIKNNGIGGDGDHPGHHHLLQLHNNDHLNENPPLILKSAKIIKTQETTK